MAEYGYSMPYRGTTIPPLPPGYMEAATAPGRYLAAGIAQLGAGIGQAIQRYQDNKAQNEAATQTFETLSGMAQQALSSDPQYIAAQQYYETGQLPPGVTEADINRFTQKVQADRSMLNRMVGLGEKFGDMSVAKKKAAIGDMAMVLQQYQQRGEQEMKREAGQLALDKARREAETQKQLDVLMRQAGNLPTTQTVNIPEQYQVPIPPPVSGARPGVQAPAPQMTVEEFARQKVDLESRAKQLEDLANQKESALQPPMPSYQMAQSTTPFGARWDLNLPRAIQPSEFQRAVAQEEFRRGSEIERKQIEQLRSEATGLRKQVEGLTQPVQAQPQQKPKQITPQFETRTRMVPTQQAVPYDELRRNLAQFATERGMNAEAFGAIDKVLEARGMQKPIQVQQQQLPGGAMVIRADNKIEILPPPKPVEGKPLTEGQGKAVQFGAGMKLNNDTVNKVIESGYVPGEVTEFGATPTRLWTEDRRIYTSARDAWIENFLRDRSGANTPPEEYQTATTQYFPLPGDSPKEIKRKAQMRENAYRATRAKIGEHADFYMNQAIGGAQEAPMQSGSGRYQLIRGKEIQPIQ